MPASANGNVAAVDDSIASPSSARPASSASATLSAGPSTPEPPLLTWQIFYSNSVLGNVNPSKIAFIHGTDIIAAGNKGLCKNAGSTNCQEPYLVDNAGVTFFVRTPTNGLIKGMH